MNNVANYMFDNHLTRWMRSNGIVVATPCGRLRGPKPGVHRGVSRRTGVFSPAGHKLSPMKLRMLEIGGCDLNKAYPGIGA